MNYKIQFYLFSAYLVLQTVLLRFLYYDYGRSTYKTFAWLLFSLLFLLVLAFVYKNKWSYKDLGIRLNNLKKNILQLLTITFVFAISLWLLKLSLNRPSALFNQYLNHFLGLFIVSSFGQEFIFRGFLIKLQQSIYSNKNKIILTNGLLFGLMHIMVITEPIYFTFIGAFLLGVAFAWAYIKNQNLIQLTISHAVINFLVAYLGFFSFKV